MKKAIVTGAAGCIGSTLAEELVRRGWSVTGIDSFTDYYDIETKERNVAALLESKRFDLRRVDLNRADLPSILEDVDTVYHQAAQAGVRSSWGSEFDIYTKANINATQRLLEAVRRSGVRRVVLASSSSVYGDTEDLPVTEHSPTKPFSPYGVTKLAAEHLGRLYRRNFGVSTVGLRYFTVYGPRQRPDMAFWKIIDGLLKDRPVDVYGNGTQSRDFTFVDDVIRANLLAAEADDPSEVYNIGGGGRVTLNEAIATLEEITGHTFLRNSVDRQRGDVMDTWSNGTLAAEEIGFRAETTLREGLEKMVSWARETAAKGA